VLTGSQGSTESCIAVRSSQLSQDGRKIEASYATELQWAGQDKRDTVACEVVQWVEVTKDRGQGRKGGESTCSKKVSKFNKHGCPLTILSSALTIGKGRFSAQHCSLTKLADW